MTKFIEGIVDLWPTRLVQRHLPDFEGFNQALLKHVREMEKTNRSLTVDYKDNNPLEHDALGPNWLRGEINQTVTEYLGAIGIDYPVNWQIHAWANINRLGDYHDPHNHPHSYLSGSYYMKVPTGKDAGQRGDARSSHITFYDPRPGINMNSIKGDPYIDPEHTILPEAGMLLMWPSFLNHFIHPNLSKQTRISLSFNIVLKWTDHYLPEQA